MSMKDIILAAIAEQLKNDTAARIKFGEFEPPLNADAVVEAICRGLQDNLLTAETASNVGLTRQDIAEMVYKVYKELNCG